MMCFAEARGFGGYSDIISLNRLALDAIVILLRPNRSALGVLSFASACYHIKCNSKKQKKYRLQSSQGVK